MAPSTFQSAKLALVSTLGLSKDALHIYVGLIVFLAVAALFKKPLRSLIPLGAVLCIALLGEAFDARDDIVSLGHWRIGASLHDVINTLFWPVVLCGMARFTKVFDQASGA